MVGSLLVGVDPSPGVHSVADADAMGWWLPVLGPTCVVLARLLVVEGAGGWRRWDVGELAQRVGLAGSRSKLLVSVDRLVSFRVARRYEHDVVSVRSWFPRLSERQLVRLPESMASAYRAEFLSVEAA